MVHLHENMKERESENVGGGGGGGGFINMKRI